MQRRHSSAPTQTLMRTLVLSAMLGLALSAPGWCQEKTKEEEAEKQAKKIQITEEIVGGGPEVEPYYSPFDLKTITAAGLDSVQITKGPSSVLYGPNTLGGIVNVITRRPGPEPRLALTGSYGEHSTRGAILDGGAQWKKFALAGSASYPDS